MSKSRQQMIDPSDATTEAFQGFYSSPISEILEGYIQNKFYDENKFLLRVNNLNTSERRFFSTWLTKQFLKMLSQKRALNNREKVLFGIQYLLGIGIRPNLKIAKEYFLSAASAREPLAFFFLGEFYYSYLEEHDYFQAKSYYQRAAEQNCGRALAYLGVYETTEKVALQFYANAAILQDSFGKYLLAISSPLNYFLLVEAAKLGELKALLALAKHFLNSNQIEKAAYYCYLASKFSDADAKIMLINLYQICPENIWVFLAYLYTRIHAGEEITPVTKNKLRRLVQDNIAIFDRCTSFILLSGCLNLLDADNLVRPLRCWALLFRGLQSHFPRELVEFIFAYVIGDLSIAKKLLLQVSNELSAREYVLTVPWKTPVPLNLHNNSQSFFSKKLTSRQVIVSARLGKLSYREAEFLLHEGMEDKSGRKKMG